MCSIKSSIKSSYKSLKSCISSKNNGHNNSMKKHIKYTDKQEKLKLLAETENYRKLHGVAPPAKLEILTNNPSDLDGFSTILPNKPTKARSPHYDLRELSVSSDDEIFFSKESKWYFDFVIEDNNMTKSFNSDEEEKMKHEKPLTKLDACKKVLEIPEIIVTFCDSSNPLSNRNETKTLPKNEDLPNYDNYDLESLIQLVEKLKKESYVHDKVLLNTADKTELPSQDLDLDTLLEEYIPKFPPDKFNSYKLAEKEITKILPKEVIGGEDSLEDLKSFFNFQEKDRNTTYVEGEINTNMYQDQALEDALYSLILVEKEITEILSKEAVGGEDSLEDLKSFFNFQEKDRNTTYVEGEINTNMYQDQALEDALYSLILVEKSIFDSLTSIEK